MNKPVRMMFVGGFLGAGKTTLLWRCAEVLRDRGLRVGLITNDQAPDLVDTHQLQSLGVTVGEVAGSCFCCNFPALLAATEHVQESAPADVLIAEPVGSCTDLSATIFQPLKDRYGHQFTISPLTVLTDPQRLGEVLSDQGNTLHPDAAYIYRKQLEEADVIAINKIDLLNKAAREDLANRARTAFPNAEIEQLSAQTNEGVEQWLDAMLVRNDCGRQIVEVNYDTYAHGEAVLGWLNAVVDLSAHNEIDWSEYAASLLRGLGHEFAQRRVDIGHVKLWISAGQQELVANLTRTGSHPVIRTPQSPRSMSARMILNARVEMPPADFEQIVRDALATTHTGRLHAGIQSLRCFQPGYPMPTHRYAAVASA